MTCSLLKRHPSLPPKAPGALTLLVFGLDVSTCCQKALHLLHVSIFGGAVQCRPALGVATVCELGCGGCGGTSANLEESNT